MRCNRDESYHGTIMKIEIREKPGFFILSLAGILDAQWALSVADRVSFALQEHAAGDTLDVDLLVDLGGVNYISSGGLRVLLALDKKMRAGGKRMAVCAPTREVSEILTTAGLYGYFWIVPSLAAAEQAFSSR